MEINNDVELIGTQLINESTLFSPDNNIKIDEIDDNNNDNRKLDNVWGILRRTNRSNDVDAALANEDIRLCHRIDQEGRRDTYTVGRNSTNDIIVRDMRVSSVHCLIYCDYSQPKLRVFIEDKSANGTFVNFSLTRLSKGQRMELKSGDEIYLLNPRHNIINSTSTYTNQTTFMFFNMRERLFDNREIGPSIERSASTDIRPHIEDFYVIGDQIGSGTCGQVHKCIHKTSGKTYAVKIIDVKKYSLTPGLSVKELREEADMMRTLDHPNIIKVEDTFETDQAIFIVMELLYGGDLFDRIIERGRYSETLAKQVVHNILVAVQYLHNKNIIHRDLKPENILLVSQNSDTDIKLSDFGLAKRTNSEGLKTFCGTPFYFAPEVLKRKNTMLGVGRYGTSADMWSIGVIMYILLSGGFPFEENNLFEQIQYAQYSLNGSEWNNISESAKQLIRSLLTLRPENRMNVQQALAHSWFKDFPVSCESTRPNVYSLFKKKPSNVNIIDSTRQSTSSKKKKAQVSETANKSNVINKPLNIFWSNRSISKLDDKLIKSSDDNNENVSNNKPAVTEGSFLQTILKSINNKTANKSINVTPKKSPIKSIDANSDKQIDCRLDNRIDRMFDVIVTPKKLTENETNTSIDRCKGKSPSKSIIITNTTSKLVTDRQKKTPSNRSNKKPIVQIVREGDVLKHIYTADKNIDYKQLSDDEIGSYSSDESVVFINESNKQIKPNCNKNEMTANSKRKNKRKLREPTKTIADMFRKKIK